MRTEKQTDLKPAPAQKRTGWRRQATAVIALALLLVVLIVAQIVAAGFVNVYTIKDTYVDENGVLQTVKYTVKRDPKTGLYALYNRQGEKMQTAPDNGYNNYEGNGQSVVVFETEAGGNQYRINTSTGEYTLYASVDPEDGEDLGGTINNTRLLMFRHISESEIYSVEVENQTGKYRVGKEGGSSALLAVWNGEEWEPSSAGPDRQAYSLLCVNCGYTLTMKKLDLSDPGAPRLADGSVNYEAYGLGAGAATYTLTQNESGKAGQSYTVLVGDLTVTGEGYYAKRADRDAVYILDTGIAAVLAPVESMVTPSVIYPMNENNFLMVEKFFLWKVASYDWEAGQADSQLVTAFSYWDTSLREYTLYQTLPYVIPQDISFLSGYSINDLEIDNLLLRLCQMQPIACKKLMPDYEDLEAFGLTRDFQYLTFDYNVNANESGSGPYVRNTVFISKKTYDAALGQEVYYLYSPAPAETEDPSLYEWGYDMIIAVDPYYLCFAEWEQSHWYSPYYLQTNIAFIRELHFTFGEKQYDFILDNSKSNQATVLSSENLEVYCLQYESADHKLDYEVHTVEPSDTGGQTALDYTGVQNFSRFVAKLFMGKIEGDIDAARFAADTGMTVAELIAADTADDKCIAKIRYHLEDYAADCNPYWNGNNYRDLVLRFYEYESSGRKCLLTVEVLERDADGNLILDENGEVFTDATRATGLFYANTAALGVLAGYAQDVLDQVLVPD